MAARKSPKSIIAKLAKRYFVDAMSAMALGLFASLLTGLIIEQIGKLTGLLFLVEFASVVKNNFVVGGAIGAAVASGLKVRSLALFSSIAVGAFAYTNGGGPLGAYVAAIVGAEIGNLITGKTKFDIVLVPIATIIPGCAVGAFLSPHIGSMMNTLGEFIRSATELAPISMGIVVSVIMGMILTLPISSAAIAMSLGLSGLAGGAAVAGCAANMIGFAVASYRENKIGGLLSQGLGTSMLQMGNIVRRPWIWLPAIVASVVTGPVSTAIFHMSTSPEGAGMGTSGLVGQFSTYTAMSEAGSSSGYIIISILVVHFILPAIIALGTSEIMRKYGLIKHGDMALKSEL